MGMAAPLVCYQVADKVQTIAKADLDQLKSVAAILDQNTPASATFSDTFAGDRADYVFRDASDNIKVHLEKGGLLRPTLLRILREVSPKYLGLLVPDIDDFLDCDPHLSATLAAMSVNHGIQILSLRVRVKGQLVDQVALTPEKLLKVARKERAFSELLWANSRVCQKKSEVKLSRLATADEPQICRIKEMDMWEANNPNLLNMLAAHDGVFEAAEPQRDPIFERVRLRKGAPVRAS